MDGSYATKPCPQAWKDQCAIRLTVALRAAGVDFSSYKMGPLCKHGNARGANSLADWIELRIKPVKRYADKYRGWTELTSNRKCGIISFRGYHIDIMLDGNIKYPSPDSCVEGCSALWFYELPRG